MLRLCLLLMLPISALASQSALPENWRFPTEAEIDAVPMRQWSETKFLRVDADFNADGIQDYAHLVKSTKFDGEGFAVYLSGTTGHAWRIIDSFEYDKSSSDPRMFMGISKAKPGQYKTACGKGYWECSDDEPAILNLKNDGVAYFWFESASSIWYWNTSRNDFTRIGISD